VAGRVVQLGLIFLAVTLGTLAMSVVPHAIRKPMGATTVHCGRPCEHAFVDLAVRRTRTPSPRDPAAQPLGRRGGAARFR
jgi:hypothetical protein